MGNCVSCEHWREVALKGWGVCTACSSMKSDLSSRSAMFTAGSCGLKTKPNFGCNQHKKIKEYEIKSELRTGD